MPGMGENSRKNKLLEKYSNMEYSGDQIDWSPKVEKQLDRLPMQIQEQFQTWVDSIKLIGVAQTRRRPGLHDEPLKGCRQGQRSVRLNRSYRVIYIESDENRFRVLQVIEVNKHEY